MSDADMPGGWRASVVVPAHDEQAVIARCLTSLTGQAVSDRLQVVVVANGCSDDTAGVARRFAGRLPGLAVIEREQPGKTGALNAGDSEATALPRIFLDADIELEHGALDALVTVLEQDGALVACPAVRFDTSDSSWTVAAFYRVFRRLPYVNRGLVGLGVYGLSRAGRARFGSFPDLTGDDLYVQRLFATDEVQTSPGTFVVRAPRTWTDLVSVRTRIAMGNAQLSSSGRAEVDVSPTTRSTLVWMARLVLRRPWLVVDAAVYVAVTLQARVRARRTESGTWLRDTSTRRP